MTMHDVRKLDIELFVVGELDRKRSEDLCKHLESCEQCSAYHDSLQAHRERFLSKYPYSLHEQIARRKSSAPKRQAGFRSFLRPGLVPLYLAAAVTLMIIPAKMSITKSSHAVLLKGREEISFLLRRDGQVVTSSGSDVFRSGDEIQILFDSKVKAHLALLSIDKLNQISWYHPDTSSVFCTIPIEPGTSQPYPLSIRLDNAPGYELVVTLFSNRPLETKSIDSWVSRVAQEKLQPQALVARLEHSAPEGITRIRTLLLRKENT